MTGGTSENLKKKVDNLYCQSAVVKKFDLSEIKKAVPKNATDNLRHDGQVKQLTVQQVDVPNLSMSDLESDGTARLSEQIQVECIEPMKIKKSVVSNFKDASVSTFIHKNGQSNIGLDGKLRQIVAQQIDVPESSVSDLDKAGEPTIEEYEEDWED